MRWIAILVLVSAACDNGGVEEAKRQAALDDKAKSTGVAKKISPPVPGEAHIPCDQLLDTAVFTKALGEVEPVTLSDESKAEPDSAASCTLVRGGKRPSTEEMKSISKTKGKLGVLPGDALCNVTAFCWTIEEGERFRKKCKDTKGMQDDESMGTYACVRVVPTGEDDVDVFRFFDDDTKCILQVRGGPSMTDNEFIRTCAKTARDSIGPAQIAVKK